MPETPNIDEALAGLERSQNDMLAAGMRWKQRALKAEAMVAKLTAALEECEDYFDDRADADGDSEGFHPNKEMNLLTEVRQALGKHGY